MAAPPAQTKLRVLCLHGYQQNAEVFRNRLGSMRKGLKSKAEFIFLDAPFLAAPEGPEPDAAAAEEAAPAGRSWWQWRDLEPTRPSRAAQYTGWQASQDAIDAALRENAPVDVLLGFSQGATAVALFLAHQAPAPAPDSAAAASLRLAVVIGGFMPRDEEFAGAIAAARPLLPSLHVSGASDAVVPEERGRALFEAFEAAAWHQHPGGHMVPTCSGEFKAALAEAFAAAAAARPP